MSLTALLETGSWLWLLAALGAGLLAWNVARRQAYRELEQSRLQLQEKDQELMRQSQTLQHQQSDLEAERQRCRDLDAQLSAERDKHLLMAQKAASLQSLQTEHLALKDQFQSVESALHRLQVEHESSVVKLSADKQALEEKLVFIKEAKEQLQGEFKLLANRIFEEKQAHFTQQSQQTIRASVDPLREQIDAFRKKVEDAYDKENAERNKLVGHILELQKQTQQIGQDAINLTKALKGDNKAQGNWGEVILERLLEQSGLQKGVEYEVQVSLQSDEGQRRNPDVIVRLPEGKDIVIDSKVSLVHYEQAFSSQNEEERRQAMRLHVNSLRSHIQGLSQKAYDKLPGIRSLDFVFLFVPVEAAFMAAMQEEPGLFQEAYDKHIVLVSPTTLMATLRTVENIWRYEKQNRNAEEIARQAGGLHDQFALMLEAFEDIGKQLGKAQESFELTRKRWSTGRGNVLRRVEQLRLLGAKAKKRLPGGMLDDDDPSAVLLEDDTDATATDLD